MTTKVSDERRWLEEMIKAEDYGSVSAGGLWARSCGDEKAEPSCVEPKALGRLIEFARRRKGLTMPELAKKADVDLVEVLSIEEGESGEPQPRALFGLAKALNLPVGGVMELAGLMERRNKELTVAAVRFAAQAEPTAKLNQDEKEALEEFIKVLAEVSDRGSL